ncbi:MAG: DUF3718 domain-containing protein [Paraglaciecola sp.]|uniref:DUF3718 domain-containing protein n=1 Tax=Pseudomonadati TaxID=3379134 RepID=UPI00273F0E81|nr:DUF3718 domain-containing protein [Paraglaciecola sp.]MDP5033233.1 DUF3718 domain-containing protein [Paraglaciecola sp.]MDP5041406.1 DUF3718 domain-containing protein [Paraglaciecola sp.]MDP5129586.1 DUF3718 domain-containing protein [Paraglaciecola sp.]
MKKLTQSIAIVSLICGSMGLAHAESDFVASDKGTSTEICMAAAEGKKFKLMSTIKDAGLSKRYVETKIQCNQLNFVEFVAQYSKDADKINHFITNGKYHDAAVIAQVAAH